MNIKRQLQVSIVIGLLLKKPFDIYICLLIIG